MVACYWSLLVLLVDGGVTGMRSLFETLKARGTVMQQTEKMRTLTSLPLLAFPKSSDLFPDSQHSLWLRETGAFAYIKQEKSLRN